MVQYIMKIIDDWRAELGSGMNEQDSHGLDDLLVSITGERIKIERRNKTVKERVPLCAHMTYFYL